MVKIHSNVWFDRVILFFILFNCVVMAMEEPGLHRNSKVCHMCVVDILMLCFCSTFCISWKCIVLFLERIY